MKKEIIHFSYMLLMLFLLNSCTNLLHIEQKNRDKKMLKIFGKIIFSGLGNPYQSAYDVDDIIYIDTNLIYYENLYSDGKPIFNDFSNEKLCVEYAISDFNKHTGKLTIPDSLREKIHPITFKIDFEKDSFDYYLYSMPVWSKARKVYVVKKFRADQYFLWSRHLNVNYFEFDMNGNVTEISCPNIKNNVVTSFDSRYWMQKRKEAFADKMKLLRYQQHVEKALEIDQRHEKAAREKWKAMQKSGN